MFNRKYIFNGFIVHCHVGLPECKWLVNVSDKMDYNPKRRFISFYVGYKTVTKLLIIYKPPGTS